MSSRDASTVTLSIPEAAAKLGKSPRQVRAMILNGQLPARKVGSRWLIDANDLAPSDQQLAATERKDRQLRTAVATASGSPASR